MTRGTRRLFLLSALLLAAFLLLLILVQTVDVRPTGVADTDIGLAAWNFAVRDLIGGGHARWDTVTDALCLLSLAVAAGHALLGLLQWIRRRSLRRVDAGLLLLGGLYLLTVGVFLLFELCVVNYRPVLVEGVPEASFPSTHTLLAVCILETAALYWQRRLSQRVGRLAPALAAHAAVAATAVGRLLSGQHWLTDVLAALLLGAALTLLYAALAGIAAADEPNAAPEKREHGEK